MSFGFLSKKIQRKNAIKITKIIFQNLVFRHYQECLRISHAFIKYYYRLLQP